MTRTAQGADCGIFYAFFFFFFFNNNGHHERRRQSHLPLHKRTLSVDAVYIRACSHLFNGRSGSLLSSTHLKRSLQQPMYTIEVAEQQTQSSVYNDIVNKSANSSQHRLHLKLLNSLQHRLHLKLLNNLQHRPHLKLLNSLQHLFHLKLLNSAKSTAKFPLTNRPEGVNTHWSSICDTSKIN